FTVVELLDLVPSVRSWLDDSLYDASALPPSAPTVALPEAELSDFDLPASVSVSADVECEASPVAVFAAVSSPPLPRVFLAALPASSSCSFSRAYSVFIGAPTEASNGLSACSGVSAGAGAGAARSAAGSASGAAAAGAAGACSGADSSKSM